jgi:hypothetical protein
MQTKPRNIIVVMPNNSPLEVTYYCTDVKLNAKEKERFTQLIIQLYDCVYAMKIEKTTCNRKDELERIVHNKVMSAKGHLC